MAPMAYIKSRIYSLLRRTEKYTKTDMVYLVVSNFWLTAPRFLILFAGMGLTVAFANLISPNDFGTYKYVLAAAGFIGAFSLNGMGQAVLRSVAQGRPHVVPALVRTSMLWSIPASLVTTGVGVYYFTQDNYVLGWGFLFIAVANVASNGYGLSKSVMVASGDFKANTFSGFPRALLSIVIVLGTLLITKNIIFILLAYFATNIFFAWSLYRYSIRHQKIDGAKAEPEEVSEARNLGTHMSIISFLLLISGQIDQLLLWHTTDAMTLAVYTIALTPAKEARGLLNNVITVAFPRLAKKTRAELDSILPRRLWQMSLASIALFITYVLCVPLLFNVFFPQYIASIPIAQALGLLILIQPLGIFDSLILTHSNVRKRYPVVIGTQIVDIILLCTLIPLFGIWGAVTATLVSELILAVSFYIAYRTSPHTTNDTSTS